MAKARTALVTGGNRGIGLAVARQLAALGMRVAIGARDPGKAAAALAASAASAEVIRLDVTDARSITTAYRQIERQFGWLDVLVNNAAILVGETDAILDVSIDDLRRTFETNLIGAAAVSQAFAPGMIDRGYGRVVNVSSRAGTRGPA